MIFGRQPAVWIGIIVSLVLAVVTNLTGQGIIGEALAGQITDGVNALSQILLILAPLVATLLTRQFVTPVAAPSLPQGTTVEVVTPGNAPNTTATL